MKGNPFLKADDKTLRINGNTATIVFVDISSSYDESTGEITMDSMENSVNLPISAPSPINEHIVDGKNYISGDMKFEVSRIALENALPASRTADMINCGIIKGKDRFKLGTLFYSIVKIEPLNIYNNIPSRYRFHIRSA